MTTATARRATLGRALFAATAAAALTFAISPTSQAQSLSLGFAPAQGGTVSAPATPDPAPVVSDVSHLTPSDQKIVDDIVTYTNAERAKVGVAPVKVSAGLTGVAQRWSEKQASDDRMYHNPNVRENIVGVYGNNWSEFGENVLQNWKGADGRALVAQWMASPPHRLNLLNALHTDIGVGLAVAPSGKLYSTQNFVRPR